MAVAIGIVVNHNGGSIPPVSTMKKSTAIKYVYPGDLDKPLMFSLDISYGPMAYLLLNPDGSVTWHSAMMSGKDIDERTR